MLRGCVIRNSLVCHPCRVLVKGGDQKKPLAYHQAGADVGSQFLGLRWAPSGVASRLVEMWIVGREDSLQGLRGKVDAVSWAGHPEGRQVGGRQLSGGFLSGGFCAVMSLGLYAVNPGVATEHRPLWCTSTVVQSSRPQSRRMGNLLTSEHPTHLLSYCGKECRCCQLIGTREPQVVEEVVEEEDHGSYEQEVVFVVGHPLVARF